jgi:hypothetical protein
MGILPKLWKENEVNMGLYIPKMKMPKNCYDCQIESYVPNCPVYMYYSATEYMKERHPDCPVVEITEPHGRLIDANDVTERIRQRLGIRNIDYLLEAEKPIAMSIDSSPTVIEAEGE